MSVSFPFLQVAFDRFASPELQNLLRRWNINLDGVDLQSLQRTLAVIQPIYNEAEVKQFTNRSVKLWLDPVKQLLYDVEDILDGFLTELQILKLKSECRENHPHQTQQGICERFESKVRDINQKLKSVVKEGAGLGLNSSRESGSSSRPQRPPTSSLMSNKSRFIGRDEETSEIVKWLLSDQKTSSPRDKDQNFSVLPIVGMGGCGKTALAQFVYHHDTVKSSKYFDVKAWVCVSEDFDVVRLTREITLQLVTGSSSGSEDSLEVLQMKLTETLAHKRFLLVLDDMWKVDEERWEALSTGFAFGRAGSKILVTTRNKDIASIVCTGTIYDLKVLSEDHSSAMFKKHTFGDENSSDANQKWKVFGHRIVEKCKGLPLAVKTLAGLLRNKSANSEWNEILENKLWHSKETGGILPSLMLSYNDLPPPLKRCFQYCALFPKDYVFDKIELVLLWMAEGIVQPSAEGMQKRVEDIGASYLDELYMRSFFELSNRPNSSRPPFCESMINYDYWITRLPDEVLMRSFFESSTSGGIESGYVMHDLIHDLAQIVSGGIFLRKEEHDNKASEVRTTTRHFSSFMNQNSDVEAIESEARESLRTIFYPKWKWNVRTTEFQCQFLRVLRLVTWGSHLPDSIGNLKQLRLLDLSLSIKLVRLPDSVTSLYNLQTLILTGCNSLNVLPEDIGNLVNLRHFYFSRRDHLLPLGVGNLTHLQRLSPFIVGSKHSSVLKDLSQLHGILEIRNLENLGNINGTEPVVANLKNKPHVVGLRLRWSAYKSNGGSFPDLGRDEEVDEEVLRQLQPHANLQVLRVENYGGTRFPSWMEYSSCFSNLETVELIGCYNCKFMPHLQQLPLLKHLVIRGCNATKMLGSELCGSGSSSSSSSSPSSSTKQFRSLVTLTIAGMKEWEEWPEVVEESEEGGGQFPCLRKLIIQVCPKLRELPRLLPSLQHLSISGGSKLVVLPRLPCIEQLRLLRCGQITTLSSTALAPGVDDSFCCLRELNISKCSNLSFPPMLPSIKELKLVQCKGMAVLNNKIVPRLSSLSSLTIDALFDLKSLSNGFLQHLTALQVLNIHNCGDLTVLLQNEIGFNLLPSSLLRLCISQCDNAGKLPQSMCNLHRLEELIIQGAKGLVSLSDELHNLRSLRVLQISICENLESLPRELRTLTSLHEILINSCPALVSLHETKLPVALENLEIRDCENLRSLPAELHTVTSLRQILIERCPALVSLHETKLPVALENLEIKDCENLRSLPVELHTVTSLRQILIQRCPALVYLHETKLPAALEKLEIRDCENLRSFPGELHTVTSLPQILIERCPALVSLHETKLTAALEKLEIRDCENLRSLPDELHITSLRLILIERCPALVSLQETKLPAALEKMEIRDCENLRSLPAELHTVTSLRQILIERCPALVSLHETKLPAALEKLEIRDCENLRSLPDELHITSLRLILIERCPALVSLQETKLPAVVNKLRIRDCKNLRSLPQELHTVPFMHYILIERCPALVSLQETKLPAVLNKLRIRDCKNLQSLPKELHCVMLMRQLLIERCPALVSLHETKLPAGLDNLGIIDCENLRSLPMELHTVTSLQQILIGRCPALMSLQETKLPVVVENLNVRDCENLQSSREELHAVTSLRKILIERCPALVSFQEMKFPDALMHLEITDLMNLESVLMRPEHNLTSLQSLRLSGCPNLKSLPEGLHKLTSLKRLELKDCHALESFPDMGLPTALRQLTIHNCGKLNLQKSEIVGCSSLMMDGKNQEPQLYRGIHNLTKLEDLTIRECPALVSIPKGMLPTNLQYFSIYSCPILETLDALSDLTSLDSLVIMDCPLLTQRYQKKRGEEWSKISQIHYVIIDGKRLDQFK